MLRECGTLRDPVARPLVWVMVTVALSFGCGVASSDAQTHALRERIAENHVAFVPAGDGPFPTLIAIPGCSGIAFQDPAVEASHPDLREDDRLFRRHYLRAAARFRAGGFAVLLIHVHAAEGLVTACSGEIQAERLAEYIDEAIGWAPELEFVDSQRIHVIGWSMGGWGLLAWLHGPRRHLSMVRSAIAVYPGCFDLEPPTNRVPLLMLLGEADDIADPSVCERLIEGSTISSVAAVRTYPGARHGYDVAGAPGVLPIGSDMTIGYQEAAAEASWNEIFTFLTRGK